RPFLPIRTTVMRLFLSFLLLATASVELRAQAAPSNTLTLEQALEIAAKNNPQYQQAVLGRNRPLAQVRAAYGNFLPSADGSFGLGCREGRPQNFGGVNIGATSDILSSSWSIQARSDISWNSFNRLKSANASLDAADAEVEAARYNLRSMVT